MKTTLPHHPSNELSSALSKCAALEARLDALTDAARGRYPDIIKIEDGWDLAMADLDRYENP